MAQTSQTVAVDLGDRSYDIHIGAGLLPRIGALINPVMKAKKLAVITDENVHGHHGAALATALADYEVHWIIRPAGEAQKSMDVLDKVLEQLFEAGLDRSDMIIAFGGGVIGDLAGFTASIYKRGCPFIQIPTTLLAQVDSLSAERRRLITALARTLLGPFISPKWLSPIRMFFQPCRRAR